MRVLLDTHVFLWIVTDDPKLSTRARKLISARALLREFDAGVAAGYAATMSRSHASSAA